MHSASICSGKAQSCLRHARPSRSSVTVRASGSKYSATKWWDASTTAVVTGANKGIGFQIACELAKAGVTTIVTARNAELGEEARDKIEAAAEAEGITAAVLFQQLDITDGESVSQFAQWIEDYVGGVNILINNAGFAYKGPVFGSEEAQATLKTNYYGTALVCNGLLSVLREGSRIVNVSSRAGFSERVVPNPELRKRFLEADKESDLDALCQKFVEDVRAGRHVEEGWSSSMYGVSKLGCSMFTRILAKVMEESGVMVNACCPGYCATDMSSNGGPKTALEGADTPLWLALRPQEDFVTGKMWTEREEVPW